MLLESGWTQVAFPTNGAAVKLLHIIGSPLCRTEQDQQDSDRIGFCSIVPYYGFICLKLLLRLYFVIDSVKKKVLGFVNFDILLYTEMSSFK